MKRLLTLTATLLCGQLHAAALTNPGFEEGWNGWINSNKDGRSTGISGHHYNGQKSAKLTSSAGSIGQTVAVKANTQYRVAAMVKGAGIVGIKVADQLHFERQGKTKDWQPIEVVFNSGNATQVAVFAQYNGHTSYFDDFAISEVYDPSLSAAQSVQLLDSGLSPDLAPGQNFELIDWYLSTPEDDGRGLSNRISERELVAGYQHRDYFYTAADGGMVLRATVAGTRTSNKTKYTRSELREMLRGGDEKITTKGDKDAPNANNWVFSSAPRAAQKLAGAVDGTLAATLAVNHVTTTGKAYQIGRVIIGQIHAKNDEPIRLYYRKLPGNQRGSIYAAHEVAGGEDRWYDIIGSRANNATDPSNGIALNERFSYAIVAKGNTLGVVISQNNEVRGTAVIDMTDSGYDVADDYMYFKAGVYNQNNSGAPNDYVQATFYALDASHDSVAN